MAGPILLDNIEVINDVYRGGIEDTDILRDRDLISAFVHGSLVDTSPLANLIERYSDKEALQQAYVNGRKAVVTATNMRTGMVARIESSMENMDNWEKYVLASASMPAIMPLVNIHGDDYGDGGLIDTIPVAPVLWDRHIDRIIVVINSPLETKHLERNPSGLIDILMRTVDIMVSEIARNDLPQMCRNRELIIISPERHLGDVLDFNPKAMENIWLYGFDRAGEIMEAL